MTLDILIATYNRAQLLRRTLDSVLLAAERPASLKFTVTVCDNCSKDETPAVVAEYVERFGPELRYVYASTPGKSAALNTGIEVTSGDIVAMIDDDEEVDRDWLTCIARVFEDSQVDFIGGPCVPRWTMVPPDWLPSGYGAVIGRVDSGSEPRQYGPDFDGILMGGNAVIRRRVLEAVGDYRTDIQRTPTRLMSCEDEDIYKRLLAAGARGFYRPDLIIHHYVAPERITRNYFRRWCFWRGVSLGILDREQPQNVRYLLGIPRYLIGCAVRTTPALITGVLSGDRSARFGAELAWWDLLGFVYGRHRPRGVPSRKPTASVAVQDGD